MNPDPAKSLMRTPRVFISRTTTGLKGLADEIAVILRERGFHPIIQTGFLPDWRSVPQMLQDKLLASDSVIALIGPVHGGEPDHEPAHLRDPRTHGRSFSFTQANTWNIGAISLFQFVVVVEYTEENDIQGNYELWVYDIPYILVKRDARDSGKREPLRRVEEYFRLCSESNDIDEMSLQTFIDGHVSFAYGLWQVRRFGLVLPNPEVNKEKKVPVVPGGLSDLYGEKIAEVAEHAKLYLEKDKYNY
jgi:hypothetical protein